MNLSLFLVRQIFLLAIYQCSFGGENCEKRKIKILIGDATNRRKGSKVFKLKINRQSSVKKPTSKNTSGNNTFHIFILFTYVTHINPG